MATPQEIRKIRLANDYKQMCNIQGDVISWVPVKGTPPHVDEYRITINVRTITGVNGNQPQYRESSVVFVTLPPGYPQSPPIARMETQPIYCPSWGAAWCPGQWGISEALGDYVIRLTKSLQYNLGLTAPHRNSRSGVDGWYNANKDSGLFPCDTTVLPDPSASPEEQEKAQSSIGFRVITKANKETTVPTKAGSFVIKSKPA